MGTSNTSASHLHNPSFQLFSVSLCTLETIKREGWRADWARERIWSGDPSYPTVWGTSGLRLDVVVS